MEPLKSATSSGDFPSAEDETYIWSGGNTELRPKGLLHASVVTVCRAEKMSPSVAAVDVLSLTL